MTRGDFVIVCDESEKYMRGHSELRFLSAVPNWNALDVRHDIDVKEKRAFQSAFLQVPWNQLLAQQPSGTSN